MKPAVYAVVALLVLGNFHSSAKAQIAYVPEVGLIPTGATMTVTPVVSADRRYVRLSVNAFFNDLNFFSTFSFPGGAVGGGNFGGLGAGFNAGMNGVIGDEGYVSGIQVDAAVNAPAVGTHSNANADAMRAGPLPGAAAGGLGDPLLSGAALQQGNGFGMIPGFDNEEASLISAMEQGPSRSVRSTTGDRARSPRRSARKSPKPTRRQTTAAKKANRAESSKPQ
jgi:hypothetical protein